MKMQLRLSPDVLAIDAAHVAHQIETRIRESILQHLKRKGAVLGLSGGIDSSVAAALCVRALGRDRVLGLLMPEADSGEETSRLAQLLADVLGIRTVTEDIPSTSSPSGTHTHPPDRLRPAKPPLSLIRGESAQHKRLAREQRAGAVLCGADVACALSVP
jgi:NAD+ synthase